MDEDLRGWRGMRLYTLKQGRMEEGKRRKPLRPVLMRATMNERVIMLTCYHVNVLTCYHVNVLSCYHASVPARWQMRQYLLTAEKMLILFAGEKGGSGKSTLAVQIGIERVRHGHSALIIDGDPQATASNWISRRTMQPQVRCMAMNAADFYRKIPELVDEHEDIVMDIAGRDSEEMRCALGFVDIAVFPVRPTMNDLETAQRMDKLVGQFLTVKNHIKKSFFVLSQAPSNPFRLSTSKDALEYLAECENIAASSVVICSRSAYERASLEGVSVSELRNPPAAKAKNEISRLYKEIFSDDGK